MKRLALIVLLAIGCGGDGNIGTADRTRAESQTDCTMFAAFFCGAAAACGNGVAAACDSAYANFCTNVVGENAGLVNCEADISREACAQLTAGTLPTSCSMLFPSNGTSPPVVVAPPGTGGTVVAVPPGTGGTVVVVPPGTGGVTATGTGGTAPPPAPTTHILDQNGGLRRVAAGGRWYVGPFTVPAGTTVTYQIVDMPDGSSDTMSFVVAASSMASNATSVQLQGYGVENSVASVSTTTIALPAGSYDLFCNCANIIDQCLFTDTVTALY